jgi:hypothetical protein
MWNTDIPQAQSQDTVATLYGQAKYTEDTMEEVQNN